MHSSPNPLHLSSPPGTVPLPTASEFCVGTGYRPGTSKHPVQRCLSAWAQEIFPAFGDRRKIFKAMAEVAHDLFPLALIPENPENSIVTLNDMVIGKMSRPKTKLAAVWERAMALAGYTNVEEYSRGQWNDLPPLSPS